MIVFIEHQRPDHYIDSQLHFYLVGATHHPFIERSVLPVLLDLWLV